MNTESIDIGATLRRWFRLLGFSAASTDGDTLSGVRAGGDAPTHTMGVQAGQPRGVPHQGILGFAVVRPVDSVLTPQRLRAGRDTVSATAATSG